MPDLRLLGKALVQQGPWRGQRLDVTSRWFLAAMRQKIEAIDWVAARDDVRRFLTAGEQSGVESWSTEFFLYHLNRLAEYLPPTQV